jgi:hypothetical protein
MDFDKYQKLEKKIKRQSFNSAYKGINRWALIFSIFGNFASIFFAYFLLSSLLKDSMPDVESEVGIAIISIIFLVMFEMLKRYVFNKFSLEHIRAKFKFLRKEVLVLTLFSGMMISGSFYLSLNGAQKFTDKLDYIEQESDNQYVAYQDSINNMYDVKIQDIEDKSIALREENDILRNQNIQINEEAEEIYSYSTKKAKYKLIEQNNEIINKNMEKIDSNDEKVEELEQERDQILADKKAELETDADALVAKGSKNSIKFIILSSFIELIILIGIYFNCFYDYRSYREYEENIKADPNFNKWVNYDRLIELIYNNGMNVTRVGDTVVSMKRLEDLARINNYLKMDGKVIADGFKVLNHLGIVTTKGSKRIVEVDYEVAKEVLKDYFNIV